MPMMEIAVEEVPMTEDERTPDPYSDDLSLPTLMLLLATYTETIQLTNESCNAIANDHGCSWVHTFAFGLPKDLVRAEVNRMAQWCLAHRAEVEAAKLDDLLTHEAEVREGGH